jgi:hypothetical protein
MQENKNQEEQLTGYKVKLAFLSSADKSNFSQELIDSKLLVESEKKKYQDMEEFLKKKELVLTKENEVLNTKVKSLMEENKNQEKQLTGYKEILAVLSCEDKKNISQKLIDSKLFLESEKKKYQDLEEDSKNKKFELTKENEVLSKKVNSLMQENKNQEEQLTGCKVKLASLSSADKSNFSQELIDSKLLVESEKKKFQDLEEISKKKEIEFTKENKILNTKVNSLILEIKNQEEQLTEYKEKLAVLSSADKNNSSQEILRQKAKKRLSNRIKTPVS